MNLRRRLIVGVAMVALAMVACDDAPVTCESYGTELCERACACSDGDACIISYADSSNSLLRFDDRTACEAHFSASFACREGGDPTFDYPLCVERLADARCIEVDDEQALAHPMCESTGRVGTAHDSNSRARFSQGPNDR